MNANQLPTFNRVAAGWYCSNIVTGCGYFSIEILRNDLGLWDVTVTKGGQAIHVETTETMKGAKRAGWDVVFPLVAA